MTTINTSTLDEIKDKSKKDKSKKDKPKDKLKKDKSKKDKSIFEKVRKINKQGTCVRNVGNWGNIKLWHRFDNKLFDPIKLKKELNIISPKVVKLLENIERLDKKDQNSFGHKFKHFIFTDIKGNFGIKTVASSLIAYNYNLIVKPNTSNSKLIVNINPETIKPIGSNNFGILTATPLYNLNIRENIKHELVGPKGIFNSRPENIHGQKIRFIIGDSGFKEGVDLFDVKYVHVLEPQLTIADYTQVVGRATRTCGQKGLQFVPNKGWTLEVFEYDLKLPNKNVKFDEKIISDLIFKIGNVDVSEINTISDIQRLMKISAVDRDLTYPINLFGKSNDEKEQFYKELPYKIVKKNVNGKIKIFEVPK